jgi:hypothetical protein
LNLVHARLILRENRKRGDDQKEQAIAKHFYTIGAQDENKTNLAFEIGDTLAQAANPLRRIDL